MAKKIAVVEDDSNIREVVCEYMKASGFETVPFGDGKQAMEYISNPVNKPDLYILDIMLPGASGLELLAKIREISETPVIMLTALEDEYTQLTSFNLNTDDYVTKPFSAKILVKRAQALLRRSGSSGNTLSAGNVVIDLDCYTAYENGNKLTLTLKEFEILKILMQNRKKVLSRQQLLDHVWGHDYFGDERTVDVHIKNLRKKFTDDPIQTVKGVGYKIDTAETPATCGN